MLTLLIVNFFRGVNSDWGMMDLFTIAALTASKSLVVNSAMGLPYSIQGFISLIADFKTWCWLVGNFVVGFL